MAAKKKTKHPVKVSKANYKQARLLLDNLVRAVETRDETGMDQCAGAGRAFLDSTP